MAHTCGRSASNAEAQCYLAALFEERRANPPDDIRSALLADSAVGDEPPTMHELQNLMNQLITGGYTITADSIGNAMLLLLEHPDQMRNDPSLRGLFRRANVDTELSRVSIPANSILHTRYGSANCEEVMFPGAGRFGISRGNASKHLPFLLGPYSSVVPPRTSQVHVLHVREKYAVDQRNFNY